MTQLATIQQIDNGLQKAITDYSSGIQTKTGQKPTQTDLNNFINTCIASKLNPFKKQAHLVGYDSKNGPTFTIIIGIDGYRAIAQRTGLYAGGGAKEVEMKNDRVPESATFVVRKLVANMPCEFEATVYYDEAVQTSFDGKPNNIWAKRPKGQLIKCAEANALRMAFPDELGGMYTDAEIDPEPGAKPELDSFLADNLSRKFNDLAEMTGKATDYIANYWLGLFKATRVEDLSDAQAKNLNKKLETEIAKRTPSEPATDQSVVDVEVSEPKAETRSDLISEVQLKRLYAMWGEIKTLDTAFDVEFHKTTICETYNIESTKEITKSQYNEISKDYEDLLNGVKSQSLGLNGTAPTHEISK